MSEKIPIITEPKMEPDRIAIVGTEGVGKSTFAAAAPDVIVLDTEGGLGRVLNAAGKPVPRMRVKSYDEVVQALTQLGEDEHGFSTIAIDTWDAIESMIRDKVKEDQGWKGAKGDRDFDAYGRGVSISVDYWRRLIAQLEACRDRGYQIILTVHAKVARFSNPHGEDYMRFEPALAGKGPKELLHGWVDSLLFARYQETVHGAEDDRPGKVETDGSRVIFTRWEASHDAKNRWGLPRVLPLNWDAYEQAREAGEPCDAAVAYDQVMAHLESASEADVDAEQLAKIKAYADEHKDDGLVLSRVLDRVITLTEGV